MGRTQWSRILVVALAAAIGVWLWWSAQPDPLPEGFARSNGRIEAVEIDVATRTPGRVEEILVDEGDFVRAGQVLARMDTDVLEAQRREARARVAEARIAVGTARAQLAQAEARRAAALAVVEQREAEFAAASKRLERTEQLAVENVASRQTLDDDRARAAAARAAVSAAQAEVAAAEAAIGTARSQVVRAEAEVEAAEATLQRIEAEIADSELVSPRDGRVQYRVAQPGEVLPAGGRVLNLIDLSDVYMTFFLPTAQAGRVALGTDVHLVLDAAPQYVIPAKATFVADVAQFTPKSVETEDERLKLMFRVKAHIDPALLRRNIHQVKTGLPGVAYVRLDPSAEWPPELQVRLPEPRPDLAGAP